MSLEKSKTPMGLGILGGNHVGFIHKWYWTFQIDFIEAEIHFEAKMRVSDRPGMGEGTIVTTLYEYEDVNNEVFRLYEHLHSNCPEREKYGTGILTIWLPSREKITEDMTISDYPMEASEQWILSDLELTGLNFQELDETNSEPMILELTWKYSTAIYKNLCPPLDTE